MILSEVKYKNGKVMPCQKMLLKCDKCGIENHVRLHWLRGETRKNIFETWVCRDCRCLFSKRVIYNGPEILTLLKRNKKGEIYTRQRIDVQCQQCRCIKNVDYHSHKFNRLKNKCKEYFCRGCRAKQQLKDYNIKNPQTGITFEKKFGKERANIIKEKLSLSAKKKMSNKEFREKWFKTLRHIPSPNKGKKLEEIHGVLEAKRIKLIQSQRSSGKNNPQYGKPSPIGSGNGWCGWYNGWFFRSIYELSFMKNYIEKNNIKWKSAEGAEYAIPYKHYDGMSRTYFGDFILQNHELVEVKPKRLINTPLVQLKKKYAIEWCKHKNMCYSIKCEDDFELLEREEIKLLVESGQLKWLPRYEEKYRMERKLCA